MNMKTYINYFYFLFFILGSLVSNAQELIFSSVPEDYQLYARDENNNATVKISGKLAKRTAIEALSLKVLKDGQLYDNQKISIEENTFSFTTNIEAGLHQFRFELYIQNKGKESLYKVVDKVVCGDAYIITGQSNSHPSSTLASYTSPYSRSFGVKTGYEPYTEEDKKIRWGIASGNCKGLTQEVGGWFIRNPLGIGIWGMELSRLIIEKYKVPVCIINGGSGSSRIEENMMYPEQPSLETSFGRLAYRLDEAGLKDKVKAIFWHQGESNSDDLESYQFYLDNFHQLQADWKRVYSSLEKIYLFQLHPGCGKQLNEVREIQNQIAQRYQMVEIMSTMGVSGHDGCHFSYEGYLEFAERIFPLVSRDFYGEKTNKTITPPKLQSAIYSSIDEITLKFNQSITIEEKRKVNGKIHFLKDYFFFKTKLNGDFSSVDIKSLTVEDNRLILKLSSETQLQYITYLPSKFYNGTKDIYNGPWLTGSENQLGALSFHQRPISTLKNSLNKDPFISAGYQMIDSTFNGINFKLVYPKQPDSKKRWIWRARFWGHEPQTDLTLLEKGFYVAYVDVSGLFGSEKAIRIWDDFYQFITTTYGLNTKAVLEGMSRGGLIVFNWANRNADKVASIYVDAPVCDIKSWPAFVKDDKIGAKQWKDLLGTYGFSEEVAMKFHGNPVDHMENLASQKIPILSVVGDADKLVPISENTMSLKKRLQELGWDIEVIHKPGVEHHPHSLKDPKPIVDFILKSTKDFAVKLSNDEKIEK